MRALFLVGALFTGATISALANPHPGRINTPLAFEPNLGQSDARAAYVARVNGANVYLTEAGALLSLIEPGSSPLGDRFARQASVPWQPNYVAEPTESPVALFPEPRRALALHYAFAGASPQPRIEGIDLLPGHSNYLIGNDPKQWRTDIPQYRRVRYHEIYPGVDVVYYGNEGRLEFDVEVTPGADLAQVRLRIEGADALALDEHSDLRVHTALGDLTQRKPVVYQMIAGERRELRGDYVLRDEAREVAFNVPEYDRRVALVLDPTLVWTEQVGGSGDDEGKGAATDASGNMYLTGFTNSSSFPTTVGAYQTTAPTGYDGFIRKISADGTTVLYSTLLGGSTGVEYAAAIAVDGAGIAYITGQTSSTDFPTKNALQSTNPGLPATYYVGFVTALNAAGNGLVYSTYLGGNSLTYGQGIAADAAGNAYVTGFTYASNFPVSSNAFQTTYGGNSSDDAFACKFDPAGNRVYCTYIGGTGFDYGAAIAVDDLGQAYIAGFSASATIQGVTPYALGPGGGSGIMIAALNPTGTWLTYLTRIGGNSTSDGATGIAVDGGHQVYIAAGSTSTDLPPTPPQPGGKSGVWIAHLDDSGTQLLESAWYAASDGSNAYSAGVDLDEGRQALVVVGFGDAPGSLPTLNPVTGFDCATSCTAATGAFLARYSLNPLTLASATRVTGGSATNTHFNATAHDANTGEVVVSGSSDGTPPTHAPTAGNDDEVAARVQFGGASVLPPVVSKYFDPPEIASGQLAILTIAVRNPNKTVALTHVSIEDIFLACMDYHGIFWSWSCRAADADFNVIASELFASISSIPAGGGCSVSASVSFSSSPCTNTTAVTLSDQGSAPPATATMGIKPVAKSTWTGGGGNLNTSTGGNWDAPPLPAKELFFPGGAPTNVNYDLLQVVDDINFGGSGYMLGGAAAVMPLYGIINSGTNNTISAPVRAPASKLFLSSSSASASLNITGGITLNGGDLVVGGTGEVTVDSVAGGNIGLFGSNLDAVSVDDNGGFGVFIAGGTFSYGGGGSFGEVEENGGTFHPGIGTTPTTVNVGGFMLNSGRVTIEFSADNSIFSVINTTGAVLISGGTLQANLGTPPAGIGETYTGVIVSPNGMITGCPGEAYATPPNILLMPQCTANAVSLVAKAVDDVFHSAFGG